jgi:hypothetical protein
MEDHESHEDPLRRLERKIDTLIQEVHRMALSQQDFDTELSGLVTAVTDLDAAVDAFVAAQPAGVDLTAEGQEVVNATQALQAELGKVQAAAGITPAAPAAGADTAAS